MNTKKHIKAAAFISVMLAVVMSMLGCAGWVYTKQCVSHIDVDSNGKCDNCGTKVEVVNANIDSVSFKTPPKESYFPLNGTFDTAGVVITVKYKDGTTEDVPVTDERVKVTVPDMSTAGKKMATFSVEGVRLNYTIEVGVQRLEVKFNLAYEGGTAIPVQKVTLNGHAVAPEAPTRDGYDFAGWFTDNTYKTVFSFETTAVTEAIELYANWIKQYNIKYNANFEGGGTENGKTVLGKVDSKKVPAASKPEFNFGGWYEDAACTKRVDYNKLVEKDIEVFARWVSGDVGMHTVTLDPNYQGAETVTSKVADGDPVTATNPTRPDVATKGHVAKNFTFQGWYVDAECKTAYDLESPVTDDITIYAKWMGTYTFEAEYVDLTGKRGMGASGGADGNAMVDYPSTSTMGINASNGFYLTYLYSEGIFFDYEITSDRDVDDVTFQIRITADMGQMPFAICSTTPMDGQMTDSGIPLSEYQIAINGNPVLYETIEIADCAAANHQATGGMRPFSDHTIGIKLSLQKGKNVLRFITANHIGAGGTRAGTAPVFDCIYLTTSANLTWTPLISNEIGC